ncbi:MAG: barstar family protein, partial [Gammaproteobacteria bacterium]|nr:barstar family protein [Gammaproteobacteria bacterium]
MTDIELAALLADARRAGTCHVQAHERTAMIEAATTLDFAIITLDLAPVQDKSTLLDAIATTLGFPHDFGHTWGALAASLGDLSWRPAPGY